LTLNGFSRFRAASPHSFASVTKFFHALPSATTRNFARKLRGTL
jgi:hypothetical protein